MTIIYTHQRSRMTKKQKAQRQAVLEEQRAIKKELEQLRASSKAALSVNSVPYRRDTVHYPSLDSGIGVAVKKDQQVYTGDKMIGIGQLHKSNAVPVFKQEEAKELASMRR